MQMKNVMRVAPLIMGKIRAAGAARAGGPAGNAVHACVGYAVGSTRVRPCCMLHGAEDGKKHAHEAHVTFTSSACQALRQEERMPVGCATSCMQLQRGGAICVISCTCVQFVLRMQLMARFTL